jgi:hypothetical protein
MSSPALGARREPLGNAKAVMIRKNEAERGDAKIPEGVFEQKTEQPGGNRADDQSQPRRAS